ncbi:MAG: HAMP domain-containing sensor histidine kinase [Woeseiaceae bacterium]|nr:HAMP domain-containing sensor histidine kinase [Woeseiaceae bacterium]
MKQRTERLKVVAVVDAIDYRLLRSLANEIDSVYSLIDADGTVVTGNLDAWPAAARAAARGEFLTLQGIVAERDEEFVARVEPLHGGFQLLVGRTLRRSRQFSQSVAGVIAASGGVLFVALCGTVIASGLNVNGRFRRIGTTIDEARGGDRSARAAIEGDDEITDLALQVNEMLDTLNRQLHHLREISRVIAHEFRSPLSTQIRRLEQALDTQADDEIEAALIQAEALLSLCQGLLEISEHETAYFDSADTVEVSDIVADQLELFRERFDEKGVELSVSAAPAQLRGDRWLLTRLVANLVENALAASLPGGCVSLRVAEEQGARVVLSVRDEGRGVIVPDLEGLIFTANPGKAESASTESHGIGLRMVRAIAIRHGARVTFSNHKPGTEVRVAFPAALAS